MSAGPRPPAVVVTGLGMVTAAGPGAADTWKAVTAGRATARPCTELDGLDVDFACRLADFDATAQLGAAVARRTDRCAQLALVAADEALRTARLEPAGWDPDRVGVVLGTAFGGITTLEEQTHRLARRERVSAVAVPMFLPNMTAGQISLRWQACGPSMTVGTACASGASAIGVGADLLRAGTCDLVLAGGSEAPVSRLLAAAFARMGALSTRRSEPARASRPFDTHRDGFVLGEGAAVLVLERERDARARGATPLARIAGYGASADAHHLTSPHPQGAGLEAAVRAALHQAGASPADVDHVNAHATSTPQGDLAEAHLIGRLFGNRASVTSAKGALGHTLGAAGAIEAALTVLALTEQSVPPTANLERPDPRLDLDLVTAGPRAQRIRLALSTSSGFGGQNAVLALSPA